MATTIQIELLRWYLENKRPLPWRENRDPYRIWISEVMLQQTTVTAVIPYYLEFLKRFPKINDLAMAPEARVLAAWAGLGYYSRARNLHRAAKELAQLPAFPQTFSELLKLPGFGPYTSRAVSSLAFSEPVGVLDGNVIRVLCRFHSLSVRWWEPKVRQDLQARADAWVKDAPATEINQALMELGATICTPKSPLCVSCPLLTKCRARATNVVGELPLMRPRKKREIWVWQAQLITRRQQIALVPNQGQLPFLKGQWILPGLAQKKTSRPKAFHYRHSITHHDIFVQLEKLSNMKTANKNSQLKWVSKSELSEWAPTSLVKKALEVL